MQSTEQGTPYYHKNITHTPNRNMILKTQDYRPKSLTKFVIIFESKGGVPLVEAGLHEKSQHKHCNVELVSGFFFHLHGRIARTDAFNQTFALYNKKRRSMRICQFFFNNQ